jgi:hypothetical protein
VPGDLLPPVGDTAEQDQIDTHATRLGRHIIAGGRT